MSTATLLGLVAIFALAVSFDYINGFHDTANAIATSVATRAIKPEYAILLSATANFVGALVFGIAVASTIGSNIVKDNLILGNGSTVLMAALIGAIAWNLITWRAVDPEFEQPRLIGGLIGGGMGRCRRRRGPVGPVRRQGSGPAVLAPRSWASSSVRG